MCHYLVVGIAASYGSYRFFLDGGRLQRAPASVVERHSLLAWIGAQSFMLLALAYHTLGYASSDYWAGDTPLTTTLFLLLIWMVVMGVCFNALSRGGREFTQGVVPFVSLCVCCFYSRKQATLLAALGVVVFGLLPPKLGTIRAGPLQLSPIFITHYGWIVAQAFFLMSLGIW